MYAEAQFLTNARQYYSPSFHTHTHTRATPLLILKTVTRIFKDFNWNFESAMWPLDFPSPHACFWNGRVRGFGMESNPCDMTRVTAIYERALAGETERLFIPLQNDSAKNVFECRKMDEQTIELNQRLNSTCDKHCESTEFSHLVRSLLTASRYLWPTRRIYWCLYVYSRSDVTDASGDQWFQRLGRKAICNLHCFFVLTFSFVAALTWRKTGM